jgi:hypothetical protein
MKHPTPEELVSWVYGDGTQTERRHVNGHLKECAECRAQVDMWRSTMKGLDELPAPSAQRRRFMPVPLQWAAAAAVVLAPYIAGAIFFTGEAKRRTATQQEARQQISTMRAELTQEFETRQRQALAQVVAAAEAKVAENTERISAEFASALEDARAEDRATYLLALKELNNKHAVEITALKKGLETVVALADYGFEATEQRLAQIAASTQTAAPQE